MEHSLMDLLSDACKFGEAGDHMLKQLSERCDKTGRAFLNLDDVRLGELGFDGSDDQLLILCHHMKKLAAEHDIRSAYPDKLFNDPLHGTIIVHPLAVKIIDTPYFSRLRHIKQVSGLNYVYPGANHTRFEHSIGTYHLAGKLARSLQEHQPELQITDADVLCVQIAGLCHDLGHGPFSHLFDGNFIPQIYHGREAEMKGWKHEHASEQLFDLTFNKVKTEFLSWGFDEKDRDLIKMIIRGRKDFSVPPNFKNITGRPDSKCFLLDIVSNGLNGLDVDRLDFIERDALYFGMKTTVLYDRMIHFLRVNFEEDGPVICIRDKEISCLYELFETRYRLHAVAYQHPVGKAVEEMMTAALVLADPYFQFSGKNGIKKKMSECIFDMEAFSKLTDHLYHQILYSESSDLGPARELLERIERRDLWKFVGQTTLTDTLLNQLNKSGITQKLDIENYIHKEIESGSSLPVGLLFVNYTYMHFGMASDNPLECTRYYKKSNQKTALKYQQEQTRVILPHKFNSKTLMVYSRSRENWNTVAEAFRDWCKSVGLGEPCYGELDPLSFESGEINGHAHN